MFVQTGYARMGIPTYIVEYTSGLSSAVDDVNLQNRHKRTLTRESFLELFEKITDEEDLSEELGMHALRYYG